MHHRPVSGSASAAVLVGRVSSVTLLLAAFAACKTAAPTAPPEDSAASTAVSESVVSENDGWQVLFDGETLAGWHVYRKEGPPANWAVDSGTLAWQDKGGDLVTDQEFSDFELELEWKISEGGNSGILFRVSEDEDHPWLTGPEMQILDDSRHKDGQKALTSAGANYALHAPSEAAALPAGAWNKVRLVVKGDHVEHWLNGKKIVEYTLWDDTWKQQVAESKFVRMPRYGLNKSGHLVLQDHGDPVWFRNIRIRPL